MSHRVAVTGMGLVTALGSSADETWRRLVAGESGVRPVTLFDVSSCRGQTAAAIDELPIPEGWLPPKRVREMDRASRMLLIATHGALAQASLHATGSTLHAPLVLGTTGGGMRSGEVFHRHLTAGRLRAARGRLLKNYVPQQQAIDLQEAFDVDGPIVTIANACATGANVIGYGFYLVRSGQYAIVVCAGYDALSELIFAGFDSLQAMTTELCRPFDKNRSGLVIGEGVGVLVLESAERAKERGARILGEVAGYGQTIDTHHLTQPHPEGEGALLAMQQAIDSAGLTPSDIDHVNAHGTGTPQNDAMESKAIQRCFGDAGKHVPVTSVKGVIGHTLGGAGAVEGAISLLSLQHQWVPPTANYETADAACDIAIVAQKAHPHPMRAVLSNSFGFGGANAAVVFKKWNNGVTE